MSYAQHGFADCWRSFPVAFIPHRLSQDGGDLLLPIPGTGIGYSEGFRNGLKGCSVPEQLPDPALPLG